MKQKSKSGSKARGLVEAMREKHGVDVGFAAIHVASGETIGVNEKAFFPTASVIKVPLMVEVYRQAREGRFAMTDRLTLLDKQKTLPSGVLVALAEGLALTIRDLAMLMTIVSDNTATKMLLDLVGMASVNATMQRLGFDGIHMAIDVHEMFLHAWHLPFDRPVGVEELRAAARAKPMDYKSVTFARGRENTIASAIDMARLMAMIAKREIVDAAACDDMIAIMSQQQYTDRVPRYLPFGAVANKTGTMRGVRNDAGIMRRGKNDDIAYALFSFDPTPLSAGNSRKLAKRNAKVALLMAEIGDELWHRFAR
jgi:beta-lactamase class A